MLASVAAAAALRVTGLRLDFSMVHKDMCRARRAAQEPRCKTKKQRRTTHRALLGNGSLTRPLRAGSQQTTMQKIIAALALTGASAFVAPSAQRAALKVHAEEEAAEAAPAPAPAAAPSVRPPCGSARARQLRHSCGSTCYVRLQPLLPTVAASTTYGCRLEGGTHHTGGVGCAREASATTVLRSRWS